MTNTEEAAIAIIIHSGKVLVAQRENGVHLEGLSEFPGGKLQQGESLEACAMRETLEEVGIHITVKELLQSVDHQYPTRHVKLHFFKCDLKNSEEKLHLAKRFRWISWEELNTLPFPEANQQIISKIRRHLK